MLNKLLVNRADATTAENLAILLETAEHLNKEAVVVLHFGDHVLDQGKAGLIHKVVVEEDVAAEDTAGLHLAGMVEVTITRGMLTGAEAIAEMVDTKTGGAEEAIRRDETN